MRTRSGREEASVPRQATSIGGEDQPRGLRLSWTESHRPRTCNSPICPTRKGGLCLQPARGPGVLPNRQVARCLDAIGGRLAPIDRLVLNGIDERKREV